jgi:predicted nucleic acid-binding protein
MAALRNYVLDANALIDFLGNGPGSARMKQLFADAVREQKPLLMSVVNWGEVFYHLWQRYGEESARHTLSGIERLPIELVDVDVPLVRQAAGIKAQHKIPYVDCIAGALAIARKAILVTSDRDFERLGHRAKILWLDRA